jgi:hypothetical protein
MAHAKPLQAATPWSLAPCDPAGETRWHAFEMAVREAKLGSTLYTPKPYPVTEAQVVADYLYRFRGMRQVKSGKLVPLPVPNDERVVEKVTSERVTYHVMRTENWTGMRCGWQHKQEFYFIVQVLDAATGTELARAVIDHSGLFVSSVNMPVSDQVEPSAHRFLPAPGVAMEEVDGDFGIQGQDPEYVATYGTIRCDSAFPCLAFHQNGLAYVLYHHELFEIASAGPRYITGKDLGTWAKSHELLSTLRPDDRLISLGGPVSTLARKVNANQVRHGVSAFP